MLLSQTMKEYTRPEYMRRGFHPEQVHAETETAVRFHPRLPVYVYRHRPRKDGRCRIMRDYTRMLPGRTNENMNSDVASAYLRTMARVVDVIPPGMDLLSAHGGSTIWAESPEVSMDSFQVKHEDARWAGGHGFTLTQGDIITRAKGTCWEEMREILGGVYQQHWLKQAQDWLRLHREEMSLPEAKEEPYLVREVLDRGEELWLSYLLKDHPSATRMEMCLDNPMKIRFSFMSVEHTPKEREQPLVEKLREKVRKMAGFPRYQESKELVSAQRRNALREATGPEAMETGLELV